MLNKIDKQRFIIDKNTCSFYYQKIILKNNKIVDDKDPIDLFKAIKNKKEIENIKKAHIYDGVALTKYLIWLKKNFSKKVISEISASNKLFHFRKKNKKFKFLSFPTISGTGPNGAIIHYKASNKTNRVLKDGDIYLVDSGGQYEFGTTDVTRTISLNNTSKKIRNIFTRVLKGHIAVANYNLKRETSGSQIDYQARRYLKEIGLDYAHGTGHGVGYYLNVHEGPHAISKNNQIKFKEGMIVSNEPGYYEKNNFGIRIENLIYVKKVKKRNYFENLTLVPLDGIGETQINSLKTFFSNSTNVKIVKDLIVELKIDEYKIVKSNGIFSNKKIMFTGGFENISRSEAKIIAENNGGKVLGTISKKLDYLVVGNSKPTKKKIDQARDLKIKILTEKEWNNILNN